MHSSSYVTLLGLFGKGCGCESLTEVVLLGNSAGSGAGHLQEATAYQVMPGCVSEFCSQWAYLTLTVICLDGICVSLRVVTPCPASLPKCSFSVLCVRAASLSVSAGNAISQSAAAVRLRFRRHGAITWFFHQDNIN